MTQDELKPQNIATLVEGMEVSIDVSTNEHDSGRRLYGVVDLVQENQGSKHGLILLVQEPEANFKEALAQEQEKHWDALGEKQLASIKRDMKISVEDATVRAVHKVMAEFEAQPEQESVLIDGVAYTIPSKVAAEILGLHLDLLQLKQEQEPVAYINVEERKLEWAKPMSWNTPTTVKLERIPLYTH